MWPDDGEDAIQIMFSLKSKGGGITQVRVDIGSKDFDSLITYMVRANRATAMRSMAAMLSNQIADGQDLQLRTDLMRSMAESLSKGTRSSPNTTWR